MGDCFEAGREKVGKKGVVREKSTHHEVIERVAGYAHSIGFEVKNIGFSPIKGPEGNIEYLLHLGNRPEGQEPSGAGGLADPGEIVEKSHQELET